MDALDARPTKRHGRRFSAALAVNFLQSLQRRNSRDEEPTEDPLGPVFEHAFTADDENEDEDGDEDVCDAEDERRLRMHVEAPCNGVLAAHRGLDGGDAGANSRMQLLQVQTEGDDEDDEDVGAEEEQEEQEEQEEALPADAGHMRGGKRGSRAMRLAIKREIEMQKTLQQLRERQWNEFISDPLCSAAATPPLDRTEVENNTIMNFLVTLPAFCKLAKLGKTHLLREATRRCYLRWFPVEGMTVFEEGAPRDELLVVLSGSVDLMQSPKAPVWEELVERDSAPSSEGLVEVRHHVRRFRRATEGLPAKLAPAAAQDVGGPGGVTAGPSRGVNASGRRGSSSARSPPRPGASSGSFAELFTGAAIECFPGRCHKFAAATGADSTSVIVIESAVCDRYLKQLHQLTYMSVDRFLQQEVVTFAAWSLRALHAVHDTVLIQHYAESGVLTTRPASRYVVYSGKMRDANTGAVFSIGDILPLRRVLVASPDPCDVLITLATSPVGRVWPESGMNWSLRYQRQRQKDAVEQSRAAAEALAAAEDAQQREEEEQLCAHVRLLRRQREEELEEKLKHQLSMARYARHCAVKSKVHHARKRDSGEVRGKLQRLSADRRRRGRASVSSDTPRTAAATTPTPRKKPTFSDLFHSVFIDDVGQVAPPFVRGAARRSAPLGKMDDENEVSHAAADEEDDDAEDRVAGVPRLMPAPPPPISPRAASSHRAHTLSALVHPPDLRTRAVGAAHEGRKANSGGRSSHKPSRSYLSSSKQLQL